jgi:hypothetical protein
MIPFLRRIAYALLWDELAARRWVRGLLLGGGATLVGAAPMMAEDWRVPAMIAGGLLTCVGGLVSVGDPNPKPAEPAAAEPEAKP